MQRVKSLSDKITLAVGFLLTAVISVALVLAMNYMVNYNIYDKGSDFSASIQKIMSERIAEELDPITEYVQLEVNNGKSGIDISQDIRYKTLKNKYDQKSSNVAIRVYSPYDQKILFENYKDFDSLKLCYSVKTIKIISTPSKTDEYRLTGEPVEISVGVLKDMKSNDGYKMTFNMLRAAKYLRYAIVVLFFVMVCLSVFLLGYLMSIVGNGEINEPEDKKLLLNRIPFDILSVLSLSVIGLVVVLIYLTSAAGIKETNIVLWNAVILALSFFNSFIILVYCISIAMRIKEGHVYKNTAIYKLIAFIRKKRGKGDEGYFKVPFMGKTIVTIGTAMLIDMVVILFFSIKYYYYSIGETADFPFLYFAIAQFLIIFLIGALFFMISCNLYRVSENGKHIANGEFDRVEDSNLMFGNFKSIGKDLISIKDDMIRTLEEKNRSQEMRNELITNLSHDLKTPLTTIVNFSNIIASGKASEVEVSEYSKAIEKHAINLNSLLLDMIEVSKISSGAIEVNPDAIDLGVAFSQGTEEFYYQLSGKNLNIAANFVERPIVYADSKLIWRVIQNLLSNICKYAMPGTNIYIDIIKNEGKVITSLRNVSEKPIRSTADELLVRFKRDDSSRTTEGSGLGLSIAKGLIELQNGTFEIVLENDVFKSVITFDEYIPE